MSSKYIESKYLFPFIMVTSLFALWGFANAVTDPMVQSFKKVLELTNTQASWVQMAFYGGYFSMAIPAALFIKKYSYKKAIIIGLGLYALGALLFYPAAVLEEFWFFCLSLYILTFGLAFLETTANPYILALGSKESATRRLNLSQSFNPLGLILGLYVAKTFVLEKLLSDDITDYSSLDISKKLLIKSADLIVIRNPYVFLGLFVIAILVVFAISKMPKIVDDQSINIKDTFYKIIKNTKYKFGVVAQAFYVGAQIMCWTYIYFYAENLGISSSEAANYQFFALVLFLIGRWVNTFLLKYFTSSNLLFVFSIIAVVSSLFTIFLTSIIGLYFLIFLSFCMSLMFPTIYGTALEDLSLEESKIAAAGLVMAIVGGALMPSIQAMIIDLGGKGVNDINIIGIPEVNFSFILPLISFLYISYYAYNLKFHLK